MLTLPTISSIDGVTVEVDWDDWNQMVDYGNGPVAGYRLYYGVPGSPLTAYEDFPVSNGDISVLEIEKTYEFAVSVLRSIDDATFAGKMSGVVSGVTQCLGEYILFILVHRLHLILLICYLFSLRLIEICCFCYFWCKF